MGTEFHAKESANNTDNVLTGQPLQGETELRPMICLLKETVCAKVIIALMSYRWRPVLNPGPGNLLFVNDIHQFDSIGPLHIHDWPLQRVLQAMVQLRED